MLCRSILNSSDVNARRLFLSCIMIDSTYFRLFRDATLRVLCYNNDNHNIKKSKVRWMDAGWVILFAHVHWRSRNDPLLQPRTSRESNATYTISAPRMTNDSIMQAWSLLHPNRHIVISFWWFTLIWFHFLFGFARYPSRFLLLAPRFLLPS